MHRLDLCTLTVESAWRKYLELKSTNRCAAVMALRKHFERVDERLAVKRPDLVARNDLDHTARGKVK
jgi:hypothetical protein